MVGNRAVTEVMETIVAKQIQHDRCARIIRDKVANADARIVTVVALVCVVTYWDGTFVQNLLFRSSSYVVLFPLFAHLSLPPCYRAKE